MKFPKIAIATLTAAVVAGGALADGHASEEALKGAVEARQAHMQLYAFNLGVLGAMAKDEMPYDAEAASAAAGNIAALASMNQSRYWLPGTDVDGVEGSRALPAIWEPGSTAGEKGAAFRDAAMAMQAAAGTDLDALKAAMGALGGACGDCHRSYRQRNN